MNISTISTAFHDIYENSGFFHWAFSLTAAMQYLCIDRESGEHISAHRFVFIRIVLCHFCER